MFLDQSLSNGCHNCERSSSLEYAIFKTIVYIVILLDTFDQKKNLNIYIYTYIGSYIKLKTKLIFKLISFRFWSRSKHLKSHLTIVCCIMFC